MATVLAELTATPIKGNWTNSPRNTLTSLFRPWWPQTTASEQERLAVIDRLIRTHNDSAWALLHALVPQFPAFASANARPNWRDDDAGAPTSSEIGNLGPYLAEIRTRLIEQARGYPECIAQLVDVLDQFDGEHRESLLKLVESATAFDDEGRERVRARVREILHWHFRLGAKKGGQTPGEAERLGRSYDALMPRDVVIRHAWLFANNWVDLPDGRDDNHERREYLRKEAVREVFETRGWDGLSELAEKCGDPRLVGWTVASAGLPESVLREWTIERYRAAENRSDVPLVSSLLHAFPVETRVVMLRDIAVSRSADLVGDDALAAFLACAPCDRNTWQVVEQAAKDVQEGYWRLVHPGYLRWDSEGLNYLLDHLLAVGRSRTAFQAVYLTMEQIEPQRLLELLDGIRSGNELEGPMPRGWDIKRAIELAEGSGQVPRRDLALLEFAYYPAFRHGEGNANNLIAEMVSDPALFMECVCLAYKRRNGPKEPVAEAYKGAAEISGSLLRNGRGIPGIRDDGLIDRTAFEQWVEAVRGLAREQDRSEVTDVIIGQWLSAAPGDSDGTWPPLVVRDLLERDDADRVRSGFSAGVRNNRGGTSRAYDEGGEQERNLAAQYRRFAAPLHISYPRVAEMLEQIAKSYEHDGRREDTGALLRIEGH